MKGASTMKNGRKVVIDKELCRKVELMLKGGASATEVGGHLGISSATVSRIKTAGFSVEQFMLNNDKRREEDQKKRIERLDAAIAEVRSDKNAGKESLMMAAPAGMIPGQMEMDLKKPAEDQKTETMDIEKLKRFYAAQIQKIVDAITALASALQAGDQ